MIKEPFYCIDLFAGAGGLSEGFKQEKFEIAAQIEMNKWACDTLIVRLLYHELKSLNKLYFYNKYLQEKISISHLLSQFPAIDKKISDTLIQATFGEDNFNEIVARIKCNMKSYNAKKIHVILSGPPCQPYSLIGRARDPNRMENDERHYLYRYYLKILELFKPDFFIYENVPGLFSAKVKGEKIFIRMITDFSSLTPAYEIMPPMDKVIKNPGSFILNSADFGVPQIRKRLILIGFKKNLKKQHKDITGLFSKIQRYGIENRKRSYLSVRDAIEDLPQLTPGEGSDEWWGLYSSSKVYNDYQKRMRKNSPGVLNHRARLHMKSDLERYRFFISNYMKGKGKTTLRDLFMDKPEIMPNHKHLDKFVDRFRVQWWEKPASTITAHIRKDGHYYIHPDMNQCRSFTAREAARCQSFPDNFKFEGPRTQQFLQIGNAVPPLMAKYIARFLRRELDIIYRKG